jgi:BioD-like phosphotransacetylase family protein
MKRIYIAATEQHAGKTTVAVGLYAAAKRHGYRVCFIKPVGQHYVMEEDERVDEDAVLFKRAMLADGVIKDLSPVTIPRGFTREYIYHRDPESIYQPIREAVADLDEGHDLMIVEGTGHAGVGAVVDASNARVARLLDAQAIIVSHGGIGRCIDELVLNRALFQQEGVDVTGVIVNKVWEDKYDRISKTVRRGLEQNDMHCLGVIPYQGELTYPKMIQMQEHFGLEVLCGGMHLSNKIKNIIVAAMEPQNMMNYLEDGSLVIVPGDRVDNIIASVTAHLMKDSGKGPSIAGLLLTGGFIPHLSIVNILCEVDVPVLLTKADTATMAFKASSMVPKLTPRDAGKIALAEKVICQHVDMDALFESLEIPRGT